MLDRLKPAIDVAALAPGIHLGDDGIWYANSRAEVSYPAHGNAACLQVEDRSFWFRHRNRCIAALVGRFPPDGPFLDIGGGNGFVAKGLVAAGFPCILVEPGEDGALAARGRGIDPVISATLEDCAFRPASMAAAGLFDVLEHIEDDAATLRQVHALLKPGGHVFATVPAYQWLFSADDADAGPFRRYTLARLTRMLTDAGFGVAFASYLFAPLPPLVFVTRTVPSWLGARRRPDAVRNAAEHAPQGVLARLMNRALDAEFRQLAAGGRIPSGGSCIVVGRRP
jgi:SAM-dependent methyltransferase